MKGTFVHGLMRRVDEDFDVFGERARHITYTYRNTIFYGVRIDLIGPDAVRKAAKKVRRVHPPAGDVIDVNDHEQRWQTASTSVWITTPRHANSLGQIYLWAGIESFPMIR